VHGEIAAEGGLASHGLMQVQYRYPVRNTPSQESTEDLAVNDLLVKGDKANQSEDSLAESQNSNCSVVSMQLNPPWSWL
jgi:hypothetical protein